jgi:hypothetical protein
MEQEARAETKKQQESELVAEQKSWSWRKKRKPCCSLAQDLEDTSYARLFFLYEQSFYSLGEAVTVGGLTPSCAHMNVVLLRRCWWFGGFTGALLLLHRQRTRLS